jgi:hypothetical protein
VEGSGHPAYHASKGAVRIYSKAAAVRCGASELVIDGGFIAQ